MARTQRISGDGPAELTVRFGRLPSSLIRLLEIGFTTTLVLGGLSLSSGPQPAAAATPSWGIGLAVGNDSTAGQGMNAAGFVLSESSVLSQGGVSVGIQTTIGGVPGSGYSSTESTGNPWAGFTGIYTPPKTSDGMTYLSAFGTNVAGEFLTPPTTGALDAKLQVSCLLPTGVTAPTDVSIGLFQVAADGSGTITNEVQSALFPWGSCPTSTDWSNLKASSFSFIDSGINAQVTAGTHYAIVIAAEGAVEPWDNETSISGRVTGADNGNGIGGACVTATPVGGGAPIMITTSSGGSNFSDGTYYFDGLATGAYTVSVDPTCTGTVQSTYQPASTPSPVTAPLASFTFLNFALTNGGPPAGGPGTIMGTVTGADTNSGVAGVCVTATPTGGGGSSGWTTDSNGKYAIGGLNAGTYSLVADPTCGGQHQSTYGGQVYPSQITIPNTPSQVTADFVLPTGGAQGSISGKVTGADTHLAISGACVTAQLSGSFAMPTPVTTDVNGMYTIGGLNIGNYNVSVDPSCNNNVQTNYASQTYPNPVAVGTTVVPSIDFALPLGATISGTVVDGLTSTPISSGVCISAAQLPAGAFKNAMTGPNGTYTLSGLTPGVQYRLDADSSCHGNKASVYAPQTISQVSVTSGTNPPENFSLVPGGSLSGKVVDELHNGAGVPNACVIAYPNNFGPSTRVQTRADGTYSFSEVQGTGQTFGSNSLLTPGTYIVSVDPQCAQQNASPFASQLLPNVVVTAGTNTPLANFALGQATSTMPGNSVQQPLLNGNPNTGSITFQSVTTGGITQVTPLAAGDWGYAPPVGFALGSQTTYLDIATTATFTGSVTACFTYPAGAFPAGTAPHILHYSGGQWQDVTTSVDTTNHIVCGVVTSLSPLAVGLVTTVSIANLPTSGTVSGGFTANVVTNGDGATSVTSNSTGVCTVSGSAVSYVGAGTCSLTAHVGAGTVYAAADGAAQSFSVVPGSQAITFTSTPPADAMVGSTYVVSATGGASGNPVTFSIDATSSTGTCSITGGNTVHLTGGGTCVLDANQAGNANYVAAPQAHQSFRVVADTIKMFMPGTTGIPRGLPVPVMFSVLDAHGNPIAGSIASAAKMRVSFNGGPAVQAVYVPMARVFVALVPTSRTLAPGSYPLTVTSASPSVPASPVTVTVKIVR
jgi:hypothetical protein